MTIVRRINKAQMNKQKLIKIIFGKSETGKEYYKKRKKKK